MILPLDFQWISLYVFIIVLSIVAFKNRKKMDVQSLLPGIVYLGLFRTNFGVKFIDKISKKYQEFIKILGLCGIGFGFAGMFVIIMAIIQTVIIAITTKSTEGVGLLLPQTNYPGLGFLTFWYFIICLFVVIIIHEFSHGIVAKANGIKIKNSGLGFAAIIAPLLPLAFVEPDVKQMAKAPDHVKYSILAAGPFSNLITALIILLMFTFIFFPLDGMLTEKDGLSFDSINESFPSGVLPDDFILREVNGEKVSDLTEFVDEMYYVHPGDSLILGDGKNTYPLVTVENPDDSEKAFIGINNFVNEVKIKDGINETFYNIYKWIRDLFRWLGQISLAIGLMNLLPIVITDGGQMFNLMSSKIFKNEKTARKIITLISLLFAGILIFFIASQLFSFGVGLLGFFIALF